MVIKKREITYAGETHTLTEWSKIFNIDKNTLRYRLEIGNLSDFEDYAQGKKNAVLRKYIADKIQMLMGDFKIKLTSAEITHMRQLDSIYNVDQYAHDILVRNL